jgi:hypothetical protein
MAGAKQSIGFPTITKAHHAVFGFSAEHVVMGCLMVLESIARS